MKILETKNLLFRTLSESDLEALAEIYSEPGMLRGWPEIDPFERAHDTITKALQSYEEHGFGLWATVTRSRKKLVGRCGLIRQDLAEGPEIEVAYLIARNLWNRGLATEAARAVLDHGFSTLSETDRLVSLVLPTNGAARRVAQKIGMKESGRREHAGLEHVLYSALRGSPP